MRICPDCGAYLDPGERCDCKENAAPEREAPEAAVSKDNSFIISQHTQNVNIESRRMHMQEKTHWKKIVSDPNYLGEADFQENEEKVLTVSFVNATETVVTAEGKSTKAVLHWKEPNSKPMILNVARSKAIEKVIGSPYFEDWPGHRLQLYIQTGIKAFGDVVNAVRVRPYKPRIQQAEPIPPCADCGGEIQNAMGKDARWVAAYTTKKYNVCLCAACAQKRKDEAEAADKTEAAE